MPNFASQPVGRADNSFIEAHVGSNGPARPEGPASFRKVLTSPIGTLSIGVRGIESGSTRILVNPPEYR
jgi:hypothetical protein